MELNQISRWIVRSITHAKELFFDEATFQKIVTIPAHYTFFANSITQLEKLGQWTKYIAPSLTENYLNSRHNHQNKVDKVLTFFSWNNLSHCETQLSQWVDLFQISRPKNLANKSFNIILLFSGGKFPLFAPLHPILLGVRCEHLFAVWIRYFQIFQNKIFC